MRAGKAYFQESGVLFSGVRSSGVKGVKATLPRVWGCSGRRKLFDRKVERADFQESGVKELKELFKSKEVKK